MTAPAVTAPAVTAATVVPVGITTICEGCGGEISATNDPTCTRCYWCANGVTPADLAAGSDRFEVAMPTDEEVAEFWPVSAEAVPA